MDAFLDTHAWRYLNFIRFKFAKLNWAKHKCMYKAYQTKNEDAKDML